MPCLVGIDIGTSSTKSVVISADGDLLGSASREYAFDVPRPGWAEQDPEVWVDAAISSMRQAVAAANASSGAVRAIGLSGQMHGTVCVDADMRPLRPAIIWADQRSDRQVAEIHRRLGDEQLAAWTGNPVATGFMLPTWLWLRDHEPYVASVARRYLLPKDYVRYRLTGEVGSEPSDASSTSLFDPGARTWSESLLAALDLDRRLLPPVYPSAEVAGGLAPDVATATGVAAGVPVIYGGSDQAMQALGNGVVSPGIVSATIGTGGQLFAPTARPVVDTPRLRMHSFCHVLPDVWHVETAMLAAGMSLRWLRDRVMRGTSYTDLADLAASAPAGCDGLFFLPYLAGERTPHMDPLARGGFVGLTRRHGRPHVARAVMEGVVCGMRQGLDVMVSLGVPADEIVASGGATRHPLWLQLQADVYGRPIRRTRTAEAAATGAAMLAGVGGGLYPDADAAIRSVVRYHDDVVVPCSANVDRYARHYELYCGLYPALRTTNRALGEGAGERTSE